MVPAALNDLCQNVNIAMVIVVPSHQNPTAATMPVERRQQLAAVVNQHQLWLVEDDIYGFLNPTPIAGICNFAHYMVFILPACQKPSAPVCVVVISSAIGGKRTPSGIYSLYTLVAITDHVCGGGCADLYRRSIPNRQRTTPDSDQSSALSSRIFS